VYSSAGPSIETVTEFTYSISNSVNMLNIIESHPHWPDMQIANTCQKDFSDVFINSLAEGYAWGQNGIWGTRIPQRGQGTENPDGSLGVNPRRDCKPTV